MARIEISDATFTIDDKNVKPYFKKEIVTYSSMHTTKTRLENKPNKTSGDSYALNWITKQLNKTSKEVYNKNEVRRPVSGENPHKDTHDKDSGTKPSKVGGRVYDGFMGESLQKEINEIKYLIEYLTDNNNKNNLI
jgi:hypothetical protein